MGIDSALAAIEAALQDADAQLSMNLGGRQELTIARLWRGQVLVDWEPDPQAGDCLLRVDLLRRLVELRARTKLSPDKLTLEAPGRLVAALSEDHEALVRRLGGARRLTLTIVLHFKAGTYAGGEETYAMVDRGRPTPLLKLEARVELRPARAASPRTPPAPT